MSAVTGEGGSSPLVCVIMPAYRAAHVLRQAADTILTQSYRNLVLAITVPAHDGETLAAARAIPDDRVLVLEQTGKGIPNARNQAFATVRADLYMFLDGDDFMKPGIIAHYVADRMSTGTDGLRFAHFEVQLLGDPSPPRPVRMPYLGVLENATDKLLLMNFIGTGAAMIDRCVYDAVGGMNESFAHSEDWQYWMRISERFPVIGLDVVAYTYTYAKLSRSKPFPRTFFDDEMRVVRSIGRGGLLTVLSQLIAKGRYVKYYVRTFRLRGAAEIFDIRLTDILCIPIAVAFQIGRRYRLL